MRSLRRSSRGGAAADETAGPTIDKATRRSRRRFARRQWRRRWLAWRYLLVLVLVLAIVGGGIYAVWFSKLLAVEEIEVSGAQTVEPADIRARSGIEDGEPLVSVDLATAERRIGALAVVRSVSVTRQWPLTLRLPVACAFGIVDQDVELFEPIGQPAPPQYDALAVDPPSSLPRPGHAECVAQRQRECRQKCPPPGQKQQQ